MITAVDAIHKQVGSPKICLLLGFISVFTVSSRASAPAWWSARGAVSGTANNYAIANQGQLKQFTSNAVAELNANLASSGGAGTTLNSLVSGWANDYAANNYAGNANNPTRPYKASDFQAVSVGQLKYIASLIDQQLLAANYLAASPSWLRVNSATDSNAANQAELKTIFNFEVALPQTPINLTVAIGSTQATLAWNDPVLSIQDFSIQYSTDSGTTWTTLTSVPGNVLSTVLTGLTLGTAYSFRMIASNPSGSSVPSTADAAPFITLVTPSGAVLVP